MSSSPGQVNPENQMSEPKVITVLVVDDHPIVCDGLKNMLLVFDDLVLVGEASNGHEALACCHQDTPDVILMDILMPVMDGIQATQTILEQYPQVKIIILSSYPDDDHVQEALEAGAKGFLLKNAHIDNLANAIRTVYSGQEILAPEAMQALIHQKNSHTYTARLGDELSERELEVLALIAQGKSNEEIAEVLVISPATAKHHVSACIQKLCAANRAQAAALAVKHGLVT
jgi:NarL family two-component system response regulator LiaR